MLRRVWDWPRERLAERVSAASYGTVLVLAALAVVNTDDVADGWGWELVAGVGIATWAAHLYGEILGDHLRHQAAHAAPEIRRAMADGSPILLATVLPAALLALGRIDVLTESGALWSATVVAFLQLVGLGAFVGYTVSARASSAWTYAAATAGFGLFVVGLKLALGH